MKNVWSNNQLSGLLTCTSLHSLIILYIIFTSGCLPSNYKVKVCTPCCPVVDHSHKVLHIFWLIKRLKNDFTTTSSPLSDPLVLLCSISSGWRSPTHAGKMIASRVLIKYSSLSTSSATWWQRRMQTRMESTGHRMKEQKKATQVLSSFSETGWLWPSDFRESGGILQCLAARWSSDDSYILCGWRFRICTNYYIYW